MQQYDFNIFNSIILAGIIQGFVFAAVVAFSEKYRATSKRLLALLITAFSLNNLQFYLNDLWLVSNADLYGYYIVPLQLLLGPIIYCYGLKLLYPEQSLPRKKIRWLVVPFLIGVVGSTYQIYV